VGSVCSPPNIYVFEDTLICLKSPTPIKKIYYSLFCSLDFFYAKRKYIIDRIIKPIGGSGEGLTYPTLLRLYYLLNNSS